MILHVLSAKLAGWIQRHKQRVITSVHKENGVLKAQLHGRRLRALYVTGHTRQTGLSSGPFTLVRSYFITTHGTSMSDQRPNTLRMRAIFSYARQFKNAVRSTWLQLWTLLPLIKSLREEKP
jgi:hypothetical protein